MAIRCPACGHENLAGALLCAKCYELLVSIPTDGTATLAFAPGTDSSNMKPPATSLASEAPVSPKEPNTVVLHFGAQLEPLVLRINNEAILGRESTRRTARFRVDLGPYGALEKGVSRMHILLRRTDNGLIIEDMGSSNGSWLNGVRLNPYVATPVKSGDRVRLSKLELEITIGGPKQ